AMANEPGKEKDFLKRAFNTGYSGGAEMFAKLAEALPPGVEMTAADFEGFSNIGYGGGTNFLNVAATIRSPEEKVKYLSGTLDKATEELARSSRGRGFNDMDYRILETRIASLDLSASQKQTVSESLQKHREATKNKNN
ncbi:MAG TPA: hypothetical protein VM511_13185, partial [Luteolibacter sp.]|nr:hypothetical protein [Luteolibacter sp.]